MSATWHDESATEDGYEVVTCPACPCALGVADARAWRLEHLDDGSHMAVTVEGRHGTSGRLTATRDQGVISARED